MRYIKCHIQFVENDVTAIIELVHELSGKNPITFEEIDNAFGALAMQHQPRLEYPTYISDLAEIGDIVKVPYGSHTCLALVIDEVGTSEISEDIKYRQIISIEATMNDIIRQEKM